jgi:E3 ubiquitin-protein ligase MGRN1
MNIYQDDSVSCYPLLIQLKSTEKDENNDFQYQLNYCSIDKLESGNDFNIKLMKQKLILQGQVFELTGEIFGNNQDDVSNEDSKNCVICIADEADVAVLPCRHMCLCIGCAKLLKQQSNKCPLCRTVIESIIKIPIEESNVEN